MQGPPWPGLDGSQKAGRTQLRTNTEGLLLLAVGAVRAVFGSEALGYLLVLDAGEDHLGARELDARVLDVFEELRLVPGDARLLVGLGIAVTRRGAGMASDYAVELGADFVLGAFADRMTRQALLVGLRVRGGILRARGAGLLRCRHF